MGRKALTNKLNIVEIISFRVGISIYGGWVTAATIVSAATMFKSLGWSSSDGYDEVSPSIAAAYIALVFYSVITIINRDPVFGALWLWAGSAVRSKSVNDSIRQNLLVSIIIMAVITVAVTVWIVFLKFKGRHPQEKALSFKEKLFVATHGLLY